MNKQHITFLLIVLCFSFQSKAQEATYNKINESWTLEENGASTYRHYKELTLHTHTAMNRLYGETFILYNPKYQTLTINESYTKQKNGNIVKTPQNAFVDVLPRYAVDAPAYNHLMERVVVHTGLELGATIYLDYTIESKPGYLSNIDVCQTLRQSSPTSLHTLSVTLPSDKKLNAEVTVFNIKPRIEQAGNTSTYMWIMKNIAAEPVESMVSIYTNETPFFVATSNDDPMSNLKEMWNKQGDTQLLTLSETICEGITSKADKAKAIHSFVLNNIANSAVPYKENGFRFRPVNDVIQSAYGTEIEKTNFLQGLLSAQGIKAEIGAIAIPVINISALGLSSAQEWFVTAEIEGKQQVLSPVSTRSTAQMHKDYAPTLTCGEEISLSSPEKTEISKIINLSPKEEDVKNGYLIVDLSKDHNSIASKGYQSLPNKRFKDILLEASVDEEYIFEVNIPNNMKIASATSPLVINNKAGKLSIAIEQQGSKAIVTQKLSLPLRIISKEMYSDFRELINAYTNKANSCLLLSL